MQAALWAAAAIVSWLACGVLVRRAPASDDSELSCGAGPQPFDRRDRTQRGRGMSPLWVALACTLTIGATLGWHVAGATSLEPGTGLSGVAQAAAVRGTVIRLPAMRSQPAIEAFASVPLPSAVRRDGPSPEGLLFVGRDLPAGRYRVLAHGPAPLSGTIETTVGRRVGPFLKTTLDSTPPGAIPMLLDLPAGAQLLTISGDGRAAAGIDKVALHIDGLNTGAPATLAHRVMRYGDVLVWFLDEGASAEPEGWWVRGRAASSVVIDRTSLNAPTGLLVRNGGAKNRVKLTAGRWSRMFDLLPGEERRVDPPRVADRVPLLVTSEAGFRPSEVDRASRDDRLLGAWLQIR
jgi:hypothetical protein